MKRYMMQNADVCDPQEVRVYLMRKRLFHSEEISYELAIYEGWCYRATPEESILFAMENLKKRHVVTPKLANLAGDYPPKVL